MDKLTLDVSVQYHEDVNMKTIFDELWHIAKYPGAEHRDRETDLVLFFEGAALAALIGIASHVIYGALTKKDVKTVSSFAMMVPAGYFLLNWLRMFLGDGRYFASLGFEAGMCMGLEVYTFTMELVYLYNGVFRKDYMLHHLLCMFFSVATAYAWLRIPDLDVAYWLFVWRSNCFMLGANFFANARLVWKNNVTNLAFAVSFVVCRVYNQIPFAKLATQDFLRLLVDSALNDEQKNEVGWKVKMGKAKLWKSHWTTALVVAWAILVVLNFYWSFKVCQVVFWKLTGKKRPEGGNRSSKKKSS